LHFRDIHHSTVSKEIDDVHGSDETGTSSINSAEAGIWFEHFVDAQELSENVKLLFVFADALEHFDES
jgi:hypothetical protein